MPGARASLGARSTMILLALGAGRRLDVLHPSGAVFLQTLLWILCAAVCGAEQYFNVEVRTRRPPSPAGPLLTRLSPWVLASRAAGPSGQTDLFELFHLRDGFAQTKSLIPAAQRML